MDIKVECYSGYMGEEIPRRLWLDSQKIEIKEIEKQWISPGHRYFKIKDDDENIYTIFYDLMSWEWKLLS